MADQSVTCPGCGKKIPLTRAIRADIEASLRQQFDEDLAARERALETAFERRLQDDLARAQPLGMRAHHEAHVESSRALGRLVL